MPVLIIFFCLTWFDMGHIGEVFMRCSLGSLGLLLLWTTAFGTGCRLQQNGVGSAEVLGAGAMIRATTSPFGSYRYPFLSPTKKNHLRHVLDNNKVLIARIKDANSIEKREPHTTVLAKSLVKAMYEKPDFEVEEKNPNFKGDLKSFLESTVSELRQDDRENIMKAIEEEIQRDFLASYERRIRGIQKTTEDSDYQVKASYVSAMSLVRDIPFNYGGFDIRKTVKVKNLPLGFQEVDLSETINNLPVFTPERVVGMRGDFLIKSYENSEYEENWKKAGLRKENVTGLLTRLGGPEYFSIRKRELCLPDLSIDSIRDYMMQSCLDQVCSLAAAVRNDNGFLERVLKASPKATGRVYRGIYRFPKNKLSAWLKQALQGQPLYLGHDNQPEAMFGTPDASIAYREYMSFDLRSQNEVSSTKRVLLVIDQADAVRVDKFIYLSKKPFSKSEVIIPSHKAFNIVGMYRGSFKVKNYDQGPPLIIHLEQQ